MYPLVTEPAAAVAAAATTTGGKGLGHGKSRQEVKAWSSGGVILESYLYAPGPASVGPKHSHEEYQLCLSLDFPGEYRYRGERHAVPVGMTVILGSRSLKKGEGAARDLAGEGLKVLPRQLDVSDAGSVERLAAEGEGEFGRLDVLVNNAAVLYDTWQRALAADLDVVREALETNTFGPWRTCRAFAPLLRGSGHGRIVNVTSGAGSLSSMTGSGTPAYNVSKVSLNALTRMVAAELRTDGVLVNAVDPGWTATDMGGHGGRSVEDGAAGVVWAATLPDDGPTGGLFYDGEPEAW